jgi:hypothetical protein
LGTHFAADNMIQEADLAQHVLLALCYFLQNGAVLRDDLNGCPIPGIEKFKNGRSGCGKGTQAALLQECLMLL